MFQCPTCIWGFAYKETNFFFPNHLLEIGDNNKQFFVPKALQHTFILIITVFETEVTDLSQSPLC